MANYINLPRVAAGEETVVTFSIDESVAGWDLAAYYSPSRGDVPWITKSTDGTAGTSLISLTALGTGGTGSFPLTAVDTGRTLGPGVWAVELWRTDADLKARLAWGEQIILKSIAGLPV